MNSLQKNKFSNAVTAAALCPTRVVVNIPVNTTTCNEQVQVRHRALMVMAVLLASVSGFFPGWTTTAYADKPDTGERYANPVVDQDEYRQRTAIKAVTAFLQSAQSKNYADMHRWFDPEATAIVSLGDHLSVNRKTFGKNLYLSWIQKRWRNLRHGGLRYRVVSTDSTAAQDQSTLVVVEVSERFSAQRSTEVVKSLQRFRVQHGPQGRPLIKHVMVMGISS